MAFCKKLTPKIKNILSKVDAAVNEYSNAALSITGSIKAILGSPAGELLTQIIPGTWDENLKAKAADALGKIVDGLAIAKNISAEPDLEKKLQIFVNDLGQQHPEYKEAMLFKIASLLTKYMHGEVLTQAEYDIVTQAKYMDLK